MADDQASTASPSEIPPRYKRLLGNIASLFEDPKFSDFIITCEEQVWKVHKSIVCGQSDVLEKNLDGQFKETREGLVDLKEDNPCVVNEMLRYMYTASYNDTSYKDRSGDIKNTYFTPMLFNVYMHTIADKYHIPALVELAAAKFAERAAHNWNPDDFIGSIEEMFADSIDRKKVMHQCAVDVTVLHAKELYSDHKGERFYEVARNTPEFAFEVTRRLATEKRLNKDEVRYRCPICLETCTKKKHGMMATQYVYCMHCSKQSGLQSWQMVDESGKVIS